MRVISRKILRDFALKNPQAEDPLDMWYAEAEEAEWRSFADIRAHYSRSADVIAGNRVVFDIGGNRYRLIVKLEYRRQKIYIVFVGTHAEYDEIDAATVKFKKGRRV